MKPTVIIIYISFLISSFVYGQDKNIYTFHPFSDKIIVSSELGFTHSYSDYLYPRPEFLVRGSLEYFFPSKSKNAFGIKTIAEISKLTSYGIRDYYTNLNPNYSTQILLLGAGISYARQWGYSVPYISILLSHLRINPKDDLGNPLPNNNIHKYNSNQSLYTGEFGIRFIVTKLWSVNLGLNYNVSNSDYIDNYKFGKTKDSFLSLFFGISLYHGGDNDSDNDGIPDAKDVCPETIAGIEVNDFGCAKDSDADGVPDYLDKCPNTPKNILITQNGCPVDNNNNGTPDFLELISDQQRDTTAKLIAKENNEKETIPEKPDKINVDKETRESIVKKKIYNYENEKVLSNSFFTDGLLFCFQVASFRTKEKASNVAETLIENGHNAFVVMAYPFNNKEAWYRIRIGFFNTLDEAKQYRAARGKKQSP